MEEFENISQVYVFLVNKIAEKAELNLEEYPQKTLIRQLNIYLNDKRHEIATAAKLDDNFDERDLHYIRIYNSLYHWVDNLDDDCGGYSDLGFDCLKLLAINYPQMIGKLNLKDYRIFILALIIGGLSYYSKGIFEMIEAEKLKFSKDVDFAELIAPVAYRGLKSESFIKWVVCNWKYCAAYRVQIFLSLPPIYHKHNMGYILYVVCQPNVFLRIRRWWKNR